MLCIRYISKIIVYSQILKPGQTITLVVTDNIAWSWMVNSKQNKSGILRNTLQGEFEQFDNVSNAYASSIECLKNSKFNTRKTQIGSATSPAFFTIPCSFGHCRFIFLNSTPDRFKIWKIALFIVILIRGVVLSPNSPFFIRKILKDVANDGQFYK